MDTINPGSNSKQNSSWMRILLFLLLAVVLVQGVYLTQLHKKVNAISVEKKHTDAVKMRTPKFRSPVPAGVPLSSAYASDESWNPFEEMERMQDQMNHLFRSSFRRALLSPGFEGMPMGEAFFEPESDMEDKGDHYLIKMDLPGLEKDQIKIDVTENSLVVSGERRAETDHSQKGDGFYKYERSYGMFSRQIPLPSDVQPEAVTANYEKGVLTLKLPKSNQGAKSQDKPKAVSIS